MRLLPVLATLCALLALPSFAHAQAPAAAAGTCSLAPVAGEMRELKSGGRARTYRLFVPPAVAAAPAGTGT